MKLRLFLATVLSLPCLALVGCGNSATEKAEISKEPMSAADIAAAQADIDQASDSERAFQSQNPLGKPAPKGR